MKLEKFFEKFEQFAAAITAPRSDE